MHLQMCLSNGGLLLPRRLLTGSNHVRSGARQVCGVASALVLLRPACALSVAKKGLRLPYQMSMVLCNLNFREERLDASGRMCQGMCCLSTDMGRRCWGPSYYTNAPLIFR
ncbi:hypothetical protein FA13DRAFT_226088 [Coprinellus micaceus]|uniref:Uncharacterized protein n=1 Tax=Coprinellus micaceus TaxID=71717 RepID=A0A4Y7TFM8_COPMI|nr:hypothetical protein FA13DRAFT_226088 [Coprinellus micaceus]